MGSDGFPSSYGNSSPALQPEKQELERPSSFFPSPEVKAVPEFIDPVFVKTSPTRLFCMTENERIGLVFPKTGTINSGSGVFRELQLIPVLVLQHNSGPVLMLLVLDLVPVKVFIKTWYTCSCDEVP